MSYNNLTPTVVLRHLNRMMGALVQQIELSEEEMMRVVFQESLPTYSKYFPYKYKISLKHYNAISPEYPNVYRIPNEDDLTILGIHKVWLDNMNQFGGSMLPLVNSPIPNQLMQDYLSQTITPITFKFEQPNIVTIYPKIEKIGEALIEVKAVHPEHMRTIAPNMREQFLKLALDDVLISLYPIRHRFESMNTPYGQIAIFMELVDGAQSDREQLLSQWNDAMVKDATARKVWIS